MTLPLLLAAALVAAARVGLDHRRRAAAWAARTDTL